MVGPCTQGGEGDVQAPLCPVGSGARAGEEQRRPGSTTTAPITSRLRPSGLIGDRSAEPLLGMKAAFQALTTVYASISWGSLAAAAPGALSR